MSMMRHLLYSGTLAGITSAAALMLAARCEEKGTLQPINATSHWLHGDEAGAVTRADLRHTGVGLVTNVASAMFWAFPFALWNSGRAARPPLRLMCDASLLAAFAALFDYGVVHRRLTPGWELAVSRRSVAAAFIAMAAGLAAGAWLAQRKR